VYAVDCTYKAPSRQSKTKSRKTTASVEDGTQELQSRVRRLESVIEQVVGQLADVEKQDTSQLQSEQSRSTLVATSFPDQFGDASRLLDLPPLQQVLPLVQTYLDQLNAVLPLFSPANFLQSIRETYKLAPQRRDPVAWAAINVVLALVHRHGLVPGSHAERAIEYLSKVQSVLSDVVLGSTRLLNVQVLVGTVMLLQGSKDLQPAMILVATTIRLAHSIGLHNRRSSAHLDAAEARQRANVFWLAYILDKDISLRLKQPSVQLDDDIDLDLPSPWTIDELIRDNPDRDAQNFSIGIITTVDGTVEMNYFAARIQLAIIEGGVYDYLYSTRAQKRTSEERSRAWESLVQALEQWKASIPPEFTGTAATKNVAPDKIDFFGALNNTSLLCTAFINRAHAWELQWMALGRTANLDGAVNQLSSQLPSQWDVLVDAARELLVLFGHCRDPDRWSFW
jgi:hypothetical protein